MDVAIVAAKRTPIGSLLGNLSTVSAPELGSTAIGAALIESNVGEINSLSSIYKNSAQGFIGDFFYNCCVKVSTSYKPLPPTIPSIIFIL